MGITFNADEVFEMAERIEQNGGIFYRRAAENSSEGRELLTAIAEQEDLHLQLFQKMRAQLSDNETAATTFDPYDEALLYLQAIADGHVFDLKSDDPAALLTGDENLDDIIVLAIRAEKDSIAFFVGMKELMPQNKDKMDDLIREEMKHVRWLTEKKVS